LALYLDPVSLHSRVYSRGTVKESTAVVFSYNVKLEKLTKLGSTLLQALVPISNMKSADKVSRDLPESLRRVNIVNQTLPAREDPITPATLP
jgi:hypothetical protein